MGRVMKTSKMPDIFLAPRQYVQRHGILQEAGKYFQTFGRPPMIRGDSLVLAILPPILKDPIAEAGLFPSYVLFGGECNRAEIIRLVNTARQGNMDFIVGTGGGKAIDTSRMVADRLQVPLVTVPP